MSRKLASGFVIALLISGIGQGMAPAMGEVVAATDEGDLGAWVSRNYILDGLAVSEVSDGESTLRVFGGGIALVPQVGTDSALIGVDIPSPVVDPGADEGDGVDTGLLPGETAVGPSVYEMSLAAGLSHAEACKFAADMDPYGCQTYAQWAAQDATDMNASTSIGSSKMVGNPICGEFVTTKGDGSKHVYACTTRLQDAWTSTHRFIANKMKATGWTEDPGAFFDRIVGVGTKVSYTSPYSHVTDWDPEATETVGSCSTNTTTTATGKSGANYSTSAQVCPNKLNPWFTMASGLMRTFGAKWSGEAAPSDERRAVVATSVQAIARGSNYGATNHYSISWN